MLNIEADEAGKLRRFREKFGRGWDASAPSSGGKKIVEGVEGGEGGGAAVEQAEGDRKEEEDNLMDLISGYGREKEEQGLGKAAKGSKDKSGKGKGGES